MKILIIEDGHDTALEIAEVLQGLGEINVCTTPGFFTGEKRIMPAKEAVVNLIKGADVILLDSNLGECGYTGKDLYPHCMEKIVIGISNTDEFGEFNFSGKRCLDRGDTAAELRSLVEKHAK